jgi:hypothetical protein
MKTAKEIYLYAFAALFTIGFFVLAIIFKDIENLNPFLIGVIETLKNGVILILGYIYGSSAGSATKTDILANKDK